MLELHFSGRWLHMYIYVLQVFHDCVNCAEFGWGTIKNRELSTLWLKSMGRQERLIVLSRSNLEWLDFVHLPVMVAFFQRPIPNRCWGRKGKDLLLLGIYLHARVSSLILLLPAATWIKQFGEIFEDKMALLYQGNMPRKLYLTMWCTVNQVLNLGNNFSLIAFIVKAIFGIRMLLRLRNKLFGRRILSFTLKE